MEAVAATDIKTKFLANFIGQKIPEDNLCLLKVKEEARSALESLSVPTTRDEYWKYTRVTKILNNDYSPSPSVDFQKDDLTPHLIEGTENRLVFINGFFSARHSQITGEEGIVIEPLANAHKQYPELIEKYFAHKADHKNQFFTALNTACHTNGAFIFVKENTHIEKPIHILHITDGRNIISMPRNLFIAGKNSQTEIIVSYETKTTSNQQPATSFSNPVTEIILNENSKLDYYLLQNESKNDFHIETTQVYQHNNSKFSAYSFTLGCGLVRNNINCVVDGENCETNLSGLYLPKGAQHIDNHTLIDHKKPHCRSNELYKGIMAEKSTAVFNGKVFVRPDAQKTNAYQSNQNILLSNDAAVNSKPELEIYADDVKCSHGSTTGQLDDNAIFYLRSRGINREKAKQLLIQAFSGEVIDKIKIESLKNKIKKSIATDYTN